MPIKRRLRKIAPANAGELRQLLLGEWTSPHESGQPLIVIQGQKNEPVHIYVIWEKWAGLNQTDRSEIIMDVVEDLPEGVRLSPDSYITVAMGLTSEEAKRMRIEVA